MSFIFGFVYPTAKSFIFQWLPHLYELSPHISVCQKGFDNVINVTKIAFKFVNKSDTAKELNENWFWFSATGHVNIGPFYCLLGRFPTFLHISSNNLIVYLLLQNSRVGVKAEVQDRCRL